MIVLLTITPKVVPQTQTHSLFISCYQTCILNCRTGIIYTGGVIVRTKSTRRLTAGGTEGLQSTLELGSQGIRFSIHLS